MFKIIKTVKKDVTIQKQGFVESFCSYPFIRLKFTSDGYVAMCCFQTRKCLGNILEKSLEEIWFSPLAESIRRETLEGKLHKTCQIESCPFYHKKVKENHRVQTRKYPSQFEIDLPNTHCNIGGETPSDKNPACIMCERNKPFDPQVDKLNEVCAILKPYIKFVNSVHIQGVAEAFWKDRIFEIIDMLDINSFKEKIKISTTTNGILMTEKRRKRFLDYPCSSLTWSLDAATPETYKKIRRVDMYEKIVENLKNYARERNLKKQFINIHNNINLINVHEVVGMVELAAKINANYLEFNPTCGDQEFCVNSQNFKIFQEAQDKIKAASIKFGIHANFLRDLSLDYADLSKS